MMLLASKLLNVTTEELWETLSGEFDLMFEDGSVMKTDAIEVIYSSYFWEYHREYPSLKLLPRHHVSAVYKNRDIRTDTHIRLLENIFWDLVEVYGLYDPSTRDRETRRIYEITNKIRNDLSYRLEEYVDSLDILDIFEVVNHMPITKAKEPRTPTKEHIEEVYKLTSKCLNEDPDIRMNKLACAVRSKLVSENQVLQCVAYRGYLTDANSLEFPNPIMTSFAEGITSFHDSLIESRSASIALYFADVPLKNSEYFARRLQFVAMTIERVVYGDCGSEEYIHWTVAPEDFKSLVGKFYMDEATGLTEIRPNMKDHIVGKTIKMRSIVAGCKHTLKDPHAVCSTCFGGMYRNVKDNAGIGHEACATTSGPISQLVLSTKHVLGSSVIDGVVLSDKEKEYFIIGDDGATYYINPKAQRDGLVMVVANEEAQALSDVVNSDNRDNLSVAKLSKVSKVVFERSKGDFVDSVAVDIGIINRRGYMTKEFIDFAARESWDVDNKGNYWFVMEKWDPKDPIFILPLKQYNMADYSNEIASLIEGIVKDLGPRNVSSAPIELLRQLFDLINSRLSVNIALLEVIVYSAMCVDSLNGNFKVPDYDDQKALGVSAYNIANRSLSPNLAYKGQLDLMLSPRSFDATHRADHPMDVFVCPNEVVKYYKSKGINR